MSGHRHSTLGPDAVPVLDRGALIITDIVVMNSTGPLYERVRDALVAYLYVVASTRDGRHPSDADVAVVVARAREARR
ncbi:hypothetical protein [Nocardia sp. NPDC057030]|uniref:hypothetical protein n=1 Tax=unclassified Nocardia TaxID=2637762 RepID=UPI00363CE45C